MRMMLAALAAFLAMIWVMPEEASAQRRGYRKAGARTVVYYRPARSYRRPASIGSNGLCQRDTGTPTSQLNFRNRCDTEEFVNRTLYGGRRR